MPRDAERICFVNFRNHVQESKKAAREKAKAEVEELRAMKLREAAKKMEDGIEETLTYCNLSLICLVAWFLLLLGRLIFFLILLRLYAYFEEGHTKISAYT